jgi:ribonuclease HII
MTKQEREQKMILRLAEMKRYENDLREQGAVYIAGMDEVGRGPLAGPVVAACVVLPADFGVLGVDDSKKLSLKKREELYEVILDKALAVGIGMCDNQVIDEINILEATKRAMAESIEKADKMLQKRDLGTLDHVLIDAVKLTGISQTQTNIIKGDATSLPIAAASIVAKVTSDRMMIAYAEEYPWYGFESNMGYGTKKHYEGISAHGITPIHRKSFLKGIV